AWERLREDDEGAARPEPAPAGTGAHPAFPESAGDAPLSGRIHREDGQPVSGAALTLIDQRGHQVSRATTDGAGAYRLSAPDLGNHVLIVSAEGHQPAAVNVAIGAEPQTADLTLLGAGELSGIVTEGPGRPLAGVTVTLTDRRGEVVGAAVTGPDGAYACHGIVAGTYTLVAVAGYRRPDATTLTVPATGMLRYDIELAPTAVLSGRVRSERGPVAHAHVAVLDSGGTVVAAALT
ncbi:carboxypeptidase regulatory-like domain-containing protein, partial [Nocardia nova]